MSKADPLPAPDSTNAADSAVRPDRKARPQQTAHPGFESLDQTHRAALDMLKSFERLLAQLDAAGLDDGARRAAHEILAFFNGPGRHHHEEEETRVFPGLMTGGDPVLAGHVRRLVHDHRWLEEDWRELAPQVQAIAEGYPWYDLAMLSAALPIYVALYQDHIALEETVVYPAARLLQETQESGKRNAGG